jgi:hypothetical protein
MAQAETDEDRVIALEALLCRLLKVIDGSGDEELIELGRRTREAAHLRWPRRFGGA